MITYQHNWPWFLVLWGLEGRGCHISLYPCLHSPPKVTSGMETLTSSSGGQIWDCRVYTSL